jgi:hypothetical protein
MTEHSTELHVDGPVSDGVSLPFIVTVQPTLVFFEPVGSPVSPVEKESAPAAKPKPLRSVGLLGTAAELPGRSKSAGSTNPDPAVPAGETLLSRKQVASRWGCSTETVKRRERAGILRSIRFNGRNVRYRLADIERVEA